MRCLACVEMVVCLILVSACVSPPRTFPPPSDHVPLAQIQIQSRSTPVTLTRENFGIEAGKCVPQLSSTSAGVENQLKEFPKPANVLVALEHVSSVNVFVVRQTKALCMRKSAANFPIFAADAFTETVNPSGVPPDVVTDWYKEVAMLIARKGAAKVAYVFDNGNAFITDYWSESSSVFTVFYSTALLKKGEWETKSLDARFTHPSLASVGETKRGGLTRKPIL